MQRAIKILHIEDVSADADLIHRELKKAGILFEVLVVDNRVDYLRALDEFSPEIILSDHSLPQFNSRLALSLLQELDLRIPFILVTATVSEEFAVEVIKNGAADYVLKDRPQRLPSAIAKALEKSRLEAEHQIFLRELVVNETLMNDAQMLAHFGSFDINLAGKSIKLSNESYTIFGFKPGEATPLKQIFYNAQNKDQVEKIRITIGEVFIDLSPGKKNYTLIDKTGRLKFLSSEFKIVTNGDGKATHIKGFFYDTTKLRAAENLLQKSEANLKTIFETTDTGYVLFSSDQQIISFNKKAALFINEQTGLIVKEGMFAFAMLPEKGRDFSDDIFTKTMAGHTVTYEDSFVAENGEVKWHFSKWLPITGNNNRIHGVILALSDITDRKNIEIERDKINSELIIRNNILEQLLIPTPAQ